MTICSAPTDAPIRRVRGEYREMPGVRLTVRQAERLGVPLGHLPGDIVVHVVYPDDHVHPD